MDIARLKTLRPGNDERKILNRCGRRQRPRRELRKLSGHDIQRKHLAAFLVCNGKVFHETLDERGFPNLLLGMERPADLLVVFEQRLHGGLQIQNPASY
jgi:hypothetical protein